jgi:protein gp37
MAESSIEWTELTWNPTTGCDKISAGCKFCYAEVMTKRLYAMGIDKYKDKFNVRTHPEELSKPYKWKSPRLVFVNSMSDLFHPEVPLEFIQSVFHTMNECSQHTFQVLTKRAELLAKYDTELNWTPNIWMGVSVENNLVTERIQYLKQTKASIKFLSLEPLLGPLPELDLEGIDWVIVGGESGRKPRPMKAEWVLDIKEQCERAGTAFFFKQWGGSNKKAAGRELLGRTWDAMPEKLAIC